jgi:P-type Mg2+ transporter
VFDLGEAPARFQTAWFLEGVLTQLAVVFVLRARQLPWARTKPAPPVLVAAALAALIGSTSGRAHLSRNTLWRWTFND